MTIITYKIGNSPAGIV